MLEHSLDLDALLKDIKTDIQEGRVLSTCDDATVHMLVEGDEAVALVNEGVAVETYKTGTLAPGQLPTLYEQLYPLPVEEIISRLKRIHAADKNDEEFSVGPADTIKTLRERLIEHYTLHPRQQVYHEAAGLSIPLELSAQLKQ